MSILKGIHLDLKGMVHRQSYDLEYLESLKSCGINALIVEYEDLFPFKGIDIAYDKSAKWSRARLDTFLKEAKKRGINVIPLQQCLGHLEYLFRWKKYEKHCLNLSYPSTLNLKDRAGRELLIEMLDQIIDAHPDSKIVHLGLDEAQFVKEGARLPADKGLGAFLDWLDVLCTRCEAAGKTPMIWSDMLEEHFEPAKFKSFAKRIILCPWNYEVVDKEHPASVLGGRCVSEKWKETTTDHEECGVVANTTYYEKLNASHKKLVAPYRRGLKFQSLYHVDVWSKLGFRTCGGTYVRASADGHFFPTFVKTARNIAVWQKAISKSKQLGVFGTSWARGNTFCPPNFPIEVTWPLIAKIGNNKSFWRGVPQKTVDGLLQDLHGCRKNWSLEEPVLAKMKALRSKVKNHLYEWDSLMLMVQGMQLRKRCEFALLEMDYFVANDRPPPQEWRRRNRQLVTMGKDVRAMKARLKKHFAKRYAGKAFVEWLDTLYDAPMSRQSALLKTAKEKERRSQKAYRPKRS